MGIDEYRHARIAPFPGRGVQKYTMLTTQAWAQPSSDPFNSEYSDVVGFRGVIGVLTDKGFVAEEAETSIAAYLGLCKGVFFLGEVLPVQPWPFQDPSTQLPQYAIRSVGQTTAWTEWTASLWRILPDRIHARGGGGLQNHFIAETEDVLGNPQGPTFPGMPYPYSLDEGGELDPMKAVKWKWLDAEEKFCPIVQAPSE